MKLRANNMSVGHSAVEISVVSAFLIFQFPRVVALLLEKLIIL